MCQCDEIGAHARRATGRDRASPVRARRARSRRAALLPASGGNACRPAASPGAATAAARCPDCSRSRPPSARRARGTASSGGSFVSRSTWKAPGSSTATVPRRGHRAHAGFAGVFDVVGRQPAEFRRERGAAEVAELVGVQLHRQAERARRLEHAPRLRRREADAFAERIDRIDQAFGMQARQPVAHRVDVVVGAARRTPAATHARARYVVRTVMPSVCADSARDAQHLAFVVEVEAVAGLDLERGHAVGAAGRARAAATARAVRLRRPRASRARSTGCRRRRARSPRSSRPAGAARTRARGRRRTPGGCGNRPGRA